MEQIGLNYTQYPHQYVYRKNQVTVWPSSTEDKQYIWGDRISHLNIWTAGSILLLLIALLSNVRWFGILNGGVIWFGT
jgi:hypothetical protein